MFVDAREPFCSGGPARKLAVPKRTCSTAHAASSSHRPVPSSGSVAAHSAARVEAARQARRSTSTSHTAGGINSKSYEALRKTSHGLRVGARDGIARDGLRVCQSVGAEWA